MSVLDYKNSQNWVYGLEQLQRALINHGRGPKSIDTLLTHIFMMGQGAWRFLLCLWTMASPPLCVITTKLRFYYPTYRTKDFWCSVDAHFEDGTRSISLSFLRIKVINTVVMYNHCEITSQLPDEQDLKWWMFCWQSFSRWGRERVASFFAYKGCQQFYYLNSQPNCIFSTRLTWPTIIDAPLTFIFKMGQGVFRFSFCV